LDSDSIDGYPDVEKLCNIVDANVYDEHDSQSEENRKAWYELREGYDLDEAQIVALCRVFGSNRGYNIYSLPDSKAVEFLTFIKEGLHSGLDGWDDDDRFVIYSFLNDVGLGLYFEDEWRKEHDK